MKKIFLSLIFLFLISIVFGQTEVDSLAIYSNENSSSLSTTTIKQKKFEVDFQKKYNTEAYNYEPKIEKKETSAWDNFIAKCKAFLARLFSFSSTGVGFSFFEILLKILIYSGIIWVIYMIIKLILQQEGNWIFSRKNKKIIPNNLDSDNIHTINFKETIATYKQNQEFRMATRYYYLWLLKSLSDRNKIEWDIEKTNTDYIAEIKNSELKKEFEFLSYIYDYCWYGAFELTSSDFEKTENHFLNAIQYS